MNSQVDLLNRRIAVCSWSLQPADPRDLISKLQGAGISRLQLALNPLREAPSVWGETAALCRGHEMTIVSGMVECVGEDYSTLESIRRTGGIVPDATWKQNRANFKSAAAIARKLGLKLVTFHAGAFPEDESDPGYDRLLGRLAETAEIFAGQKLQVGLETGQETATVLAKALRRLNCPNLGVNFDPANIILYDNGSPVEALREVAPWVCQVHIKDAMRTPTPGMWGREVVAGTGEVDWRAFFALLKEMGYEGDFVIEREAGDRRAEDVRIAKGLVLSELL
jgi:sugar phosphate isomerase/epimerase